MIESEYRDAPVELKPDMDYVGREGWSVSALFPHLILCSKHVTFSTKSYLISSYLLSLISFVSAVRSVTYISPRLDARTYDTF